MDYLKEIAAAVEYIEEHLDRPLTLPEVAKTVHLSPFYFHRIFSAIVGDPVSRYIRNRRLAKAADELLESDKKIIEIALDNFFESQESFSRAFAKVYRLTPGRFRRKKVSNYYFNKGRVTEKILRHLAKGVTMKPKIIELPEFKVIGIKRKATLKTAHELIKKQWQEFNPRMGEIKNRIKPTEAYGICEYCDLENFDEETPYYELVSVAVSNLDNPPQGMTGKIIPKSRYAVFTHKGPTKNLRATYDYIYKTWLPSSGEELLPHDDFELYDRRFRGVNNPESEIDIYLPIK